MELIRTAENYWRQNVKRLAIYIEEKALQTGDKCERYMENIPARKKYMCDVLLRVPLFFLVHQWLLLSPYSNYWIVNVFLFILRYGVAVILTGIWACNAGTFLKVFIFLCADFALEWIRQISYWSHQDEASEVCLEKNVPVWSDITESWWIPALITLLLKIFYGCYRSVALFCRQQDITPWTYVVFSVPLIPDVFNLLWIWPSFMSELSYWIHSILFTVICILEVVNSLEIDTKVDRKKVNLLQVKQLLTTDEQVKRECRNRIEELERRIKRRSEGGNFVDRFPGKWFMRDTMLSFLIPYLIFAALAEVVLYQKTLTSLFSFDSFLEISTRWCTSAVIILSITFGFGILSNLCISLSNFFLTNTGNLVEAFDVNIGGVVQVNALLTFTEANILSLEYTEKAEAMKMVAFLSVYAIIFQTLDVLQQKIIQAVNSGSSPGISFHLRAGILIGLLVTAPTLSTLHVSKHLNVSPWLLFFASGNCILIIRTIFLIAETSLIALTWHSPQHLDKLEDIVHYIRGSNSFCLILLNTVQCYSRYICPFFKGWWIFRLCLALLSVFSVLILFTMKEIARYQGRNKMTTLLNKLPDKSLEQDGDEANADDAQECAICYSEMMTGKVLPCRHIFHKDCLRRWFQVKTVCPFCNTDVKIDAVEILYQKQKAE